MKQNDININAVMHVVERLRASEAVYNSPRVKGQYFGGYIASDMQGETCRVCAITGCYIHDFSDSEESPQSIEKRIDDNIKWAIEYLENEEDLYHPDELFERLGWDNPIINGVIDEGGTDDYYKFESTLALTIAVLNDAREWSYTKIADWLEDIVKNHPDWIRSL